MSFTQIPNEFFPLLPILSGSEVKVLLSILRKTVGYQKVSASMSFSEISALSGIDKRNLSRIILSLVNRGYLVRSKNKDFFVYSVHFVPIESPYGKCYLTSFPTGTCEFKKTGKKQLFCETCPRYLLSLTSP